MDFKESAFFNEDIILQKQFAINYKRILRKLILDPGQYWACLYYGKIKKINIINGVGIIVLSK